MRTANAAWNGYTSLERSVMPISLYNAVIPSFRQIVGATSSLLTKAEGFCAEKSIDPADVLQSRIAEDMLPLAVQVKFVSMHSIGAIEGVRKGLFSPSMTPPPADFTGLQAQLAETSAALAAMDPAEVEGFIGQDMVFSFGERKMPFVAEEFLLSFSQPNFYFHATTVYAILRAKGMPLGKMDFMGMPRMKR